MYINICFWMYKRILKQYHFLYNFLHTIIVCGFFFMNEIIIMIMVMMTFISFKKQWYSYKVTKKNFLLFFIIFFKQNGEKQQLSVNKMVNMCLYTIIYVPSFMWLSFTDKKKWNYMWFSFYYFQDSNQLQYKSF